MSCKGTFEHIVILRNGIAPICMQKLSDGIQLST